MAKKIIMQRLGTTSKALKVKISKLTSLTKRQQAILSDDLNAEYSNMSRIVGRSDLTEQIVGQLMQYAMFNMFESSGHYERMGEYALNIDKATMLGTKGIGSGMSMDRISNEAFATYTDMIQKEAMQYVTNMQDDLRMALTNEFNIALIEDKMPNEISQILQDKFDMSKNRADTIARTETMRANNQLAREQAIANGAKYFVVDNREEACEECQAEYEGEVFGIDEEDAMPPLHPNCACIPTFFDDEEEAQEWADGLQEDNMEKREELELQNMMVAPDGTGAIEIDSARRDAMALMENQGRMTIPRSQRYSQEKLMYKKVRSPILQARHKLQYPERPKVVKNIKKGTAQPFNSNKVSIPKNERKVYELHIHSKASPDSKETIANIVKEAKALKLDGVAITNHNNLSASLQAAEKYSTKNFKVIPGVEITSSKGHIIALGIKADIRSGMSPERTIRAIKKQGGVAILPHSFARYRDGVLYKVGSYADKIGKQAHAIESVNARYGQGASNFRARNYAERKGIGQIAGSDAHSADGMGMALTEIRSKNNTVKEILDSIKRGQTNAYDSQIPVSKLHLTPIRYPKGTVFEPIRYPEAQLPYGTRVLKEKVYNFGINDKSIDDFHVVKVTTQYDKHYKQYTAVIIGRSESSGTTVATTIPLGKVERSASEWNRLIKSKFDKRPSGKTPLGN